MKHTANILILWLLMVVEVNAAIPPAEKDIIAGLGVMVNQLDSRQAPQLVSNPVTGTQVGLSFAAELFFRDDFSIEVDLIIGEYQYVRQVGMNVVSETVTRIHMPVLFKWHFLKYFSLGAGPYASYRMGEVKSLTNPNVLEEDRTSANDMGEHGVEAGLGFLYPIPGALWFMGMDYRQSYNLTPRSDEERFYRSFLMHFKRYF